MTSTAIIFSFATKLLYCFTFLHTQAPQAHYAFSYRIRYFSNYLGNIFSSSVSVSTFLQIVNDIWTQLSLGQLLLSNDTIIMSRPKWDHILSVIPWSYQPHYTIKAIQKQHLSSYFGFVVCSSRSNCSCSPNICGKN